MLETLFGDEKKVCSCWRLRSTVTRLALNCSVLRPRPKPLDSGFENPVLSQDQQLVYTSRKLKCSIFQVSPGCFCCEFSQLFFQMHLPLDTTYFPAPPELIFHFAGCQMTAQRLGKKQSPQSSNLNAGG